MLTTLMQGHCGAIPMWGRGVCPHIGVGPPSYCTCKEGTVPLLDYNISSRRSRFVVFVYAGNHIIPLFLPQLFFLLPFNMTLIHIGTDPSQSQSQATNRQIPAVLFKFREEVSAEHKAMFVKVLRTLRDLSCVKDGKLWVGSPSVTNPIEKSKGFEIALVSFHHNLAALEVYQATKEHETYETIQAPGNQV